MTIGKSTLITLAIVLGVVVLYDKGLIPGMSTSKSGLAGE